jgi:cytochrome c oxidase assembly protein subunit 15
MMHRIGALIVVGWLGWLAVRLMRIEGAAPLGRALLLLIIIQFCLGLSNVWFSLPINVAVTHTGGAALLLALMVVLNFRASRAMLQV